jgi:hypothetical protein
MVSPLRLKGYGGQAGVSVQRRRWPEKRLSLILKETLSLASFK